MSSTLPLAEYIDEYLRARTYHKNYRCRVKRAARRFARFLQREPTVADLTPEMAAGFVRWLSKSKHENANREDGQIFRRLCRLAGTMKGCGKGHIWHPEPSGESTKLSEAPGTLWHICLTAYFPASIRIGSDRTRTHYRFALCWFKRMLGHDPTPADLTDDNCTMLLKQILTAGSAPETANNTAGRLRTLWGWMAKRDRSLNFPTYQNAKEPRRVPKAWSRDELNRLIDACRNVKGKVGIVPASCWWVALHYLLFDTAERIGAVLAIRKEWIDWQTGDLLIPAEVRKGGDADASYRLHRETLAELKLIADNGSDLLFRWPKCLESLYYRYKKIRKRAELATDRKSAFHRMRRSVASHLQAAGHNATTALGHQSADVTKKSYIDPSIAGGVRPSDVLFRPGTVETIQAVIVLDISPSEAKRLPRAKLLTQ